MNLVSQKKILKKIYENFHRQSVNDIHVNFVRKMNSDTDKIIIEIMSVIVFCLVYLFRIEIHPLMDILLMELLIK